MAADGGLWLVAVVGGRICHLFGGGYNPGMLNHLSKLKDHSSFPVVLGSFLVELGKLEVFEITPWINALHHESSHVGASGTWTKVPRKQRLGGPCGISGVSGARLDTKMISC